MQALALDTHHPVALEITGEQAAKRFLIRACHSVVISPYTLHRRAKFFADPECFDPERFAPEQTIPRYAYLPFGVSSHICLGMHVALLEGHLILATLAQRVRFEFVRSGPIEPEPLLTLRPKGAVLMRVQRR
jgi:cytochrome P450